MEEKSIIEKKMKAMRFKITMDYLGRINMKNFYKFVFDERAKSPSAILFICLISILLFVTVVHFIHLYIYTTEKALKTAKNLHFTRGSHRSQTVHAIIRHSPRGLCA